MNFVIAAMAGTAAGFLAGMGVGGGSLLMLWLTLVMGIPQPEARSINLMFFIPAALIACLFRTRRGGLPWRIILPAALGGCVCAGITVWLAGDLQPDILRKLFGVLLLCIGTKELLYRPRKPR